MCFAAGAIYKTNLKLTYLFEYFATLQSVKKMMNNSDYASLDKVAKTTCENVLNQTTDVMKQLLNGNTSKCMQSA
jgi:dihydroneopterin aldolase